MKVIVTSDGLIGLDFDPTCDIIWCNSIQEATPIMHANFQHLGESAPTLEEMHHELAIAVDECAKRHHDIAEFGIFGSFMYTTTEEDPEDDGSNDTDPMGDGDIPRIWP